MGRFDALTQLDKKPVTATHPRLSSSPSPNSPQASQAEPVSQKKTPEKAESSDTTTSRYHDTMKPRHHETTIPFSEEEMIEAVRKAVKQIGKEPATQRLTLEEKQALDEIEYRYKRQGIKTSGNEIIRIATNYLVRDYWQHGEKSILAKVLTRLNS